MKTIRLDKYIGEYHYVIIPEYTINSDSRELKKIIEIGDSCYADRDDITEISGKYITKINNSAFLNCTKLENISFSKCEYIGNSVFKNCSELKDGIDFPECKYIGSNVFQNTSWQTKKLAESDKVKIITNYNTFLVAVSDTISGIIDDSDITFLCDNIFKDNKNITGLNLPNCTYIGNDVFNGCTNLNTISIPECNYIGRDSFKDTAWINNELSKDDIVKLTTNKQDFIIYCNKNRTEYLSNIIGTFICEEAFKDCTQIKEIQFSNVSYIGENAFNNCSSLVTIRFMGNEVAELSNVNVFENCSSLKYIGVPEDLIEQYKAADNWKEYADKIINGKFITVQKPIQPTSIDYDGNIHTNGYELPELGVNMSGYNSGTDAGTYSATYSLQTGYIWDDNTLDPITITLTINKIPVIYTAPIANTLTYNGINQNLLIAGNITDIGVFYYRLSNSGYSTSIPQGTNAGSYITYWKIEPDKNHIGVEETQINVTINKANGQCIAPEAKSLTYNGNNQTLISAGTSITGIMQYRLNSGSYSTDLPCATNANTYIVYYYSKGDSNHNDTVEDSINVTISKLSLTIPSLSNNSKTYSGGSQSPTINNYDSTYENQSGTTSAINADTYYIYWNLKNTSNTQWSDNTTSQKISSWIINKATGYINLGSSSISVNTGSTVNLQINNNHGGTITGTSSSYWSVGIYSGSASGGILPITGLSIGTGTMTITCAETNNYNTVSVNCKVVDVGVWTKGTATNLSIARCNLCCASNNNYILFAGGQGANSVFLDTVEAYDNNNTRSIPTPLSIARNYVSGIRNGNYALFGGGNTTGYTQGTQAIVEAYDSSNTRSILTSLSIARNNPAVAATTNYALFAGGYYAGDVDTVDAYDSNNTRSTVGSLCDGKSGHRGASNSNYAIFGGDYYTTTVDAYDNNNTRCYPSPMSAKRKYYGNASNSSYLLFGGGDYYSTSYLSTVDSYTSGLVKGTPTVLSVSRTALVGASISDLSLFAGGKNDSGYVNTVDAYDSSYTRTIIDTLSVGRGYFAGGSNNNYILMAGGTSSSGSYSDTVDTYKFA